MSGLRLKIDGELSLSEIDNLRSMGDLVELVKASIDPGKIIISLTLDGESLSEQDWRRPLRANQNSLLEVTTGDKHAYVMQRLRMAPDIVDKILSEFVEAKWNFQAGQLLEDNAIFKTAVENLGAFLKWYNSVLLLKQSSAEDALGQELHAISDACERIMSQMVFNSWWAISETIEQILEPRLQELKSSCERVVKESGSDGSSKRSSCG